MKFLSSIFLIFVLSLTLSFSTPNNAFAENDVFAKKLAVKTYYGQILKNKYGMAVLTIKDKNEETLQISMVRITNQRIDEVLNTGLYNEAKKAKFKTIKFIDINKRTTVVNLQ